MWLEQVEEMLKREEEEETWWEEAGWGDGGHIARPRTPKQDQEIQQQEFTQGFHLG